MMSTTIFAEADKSLALADVRCGKCFVVRNGQQALADYLRETLLRKRFSYGDLARASGEQVSTSTVSDILNCRVKDIKVQTLISLAKGLGVHPLEVFTAYIGQSDSVRSSSTTLNELAASFLSLPRDRQGDVLVMVHALASVYSGKPGQGLPEPPNSSPGDHPETIRVPYQKWNDWAPERLAGGSGSEVGEQENNEQGLVSK